MKDRTAYRHLPTPCLHVSTLYALVLLSLALVQGCSRAPARAGTRITLATTTSTENSGLLEELLPPFERASGVRVDVIAVGTGKALKLAENGDADLVLVHAPSLEEDFIRKGYGVDRQTVMCNEFIIVGPHPDPAGIAGPDAAAALRSIERARAPFVSRGDESGTHVKEKELWKDAGVHPGRSAWYMEAGQGMGATLLLADEKQAYCLVDEGTFIAFREKLTLAVLCRGDARLENRYSTIITNPERHPHSGYTRAKVLTDWMRSPEARAIISGFTKHGEALFRPCGNQGPEPRQR